MAPERKEVVVNANAADPEKLLPDRAARLFQLIGKALAVDLRHRQERGLGAGLGGRMDDAVEPAETLRIDPRAGGESTACNMGSILG